MRSLAGGLGAAFNDGALTLRRGFAAALLALCASLQPAGAAGPRNDYAVPAFTSAMEDGLRDFYVRDFNDAQQSFARALVVVPDNTLAISFMNAAAAHVPQAFEKLIADEETVVGKAPKDYVARVRLGFSYLFQRDVGRDRTLDARDELNAALAIDPQGQAAHVGIGIMRENERSANRAKVEFLAALRVDPNNVLAREYLGSIYQVDLHEPSTSLRYDVDVPNLVPGYADIQFHLASIMDDLQQYDAALAYAKRGIELDVGRAGEAGQYGYTLVARILLKQKKVAEAKKYLEQAVAFDADGMYAQKLLDKIAKGDYDEKRQQR